MDFLFFLLIALAVPFALPIASWVSARRTRARVDELEATVAEQQSALDRLNKRVAELRREMRQPDAPDTAVPAGATQPAAAPAAARPPVAPPPPVATPPPSVMPPPVAPPPIVERPWPDLPPRQPVEPTPPRPPIVERPWPELEEPRAAEAPAARAKATDAPPPPTPPPPRAQRPEPPGPPPRPSFDWESLVGVKLFSAIAGIALLIAAISFLRYSVQQGWLQPPVRVLIGIVVAVVLLVLCELKAARKYPATANALDAAAIAILFSTFFAAHALWDLIPAAATFGLLALVTALAVVLSIRRESLFIAVLGLLGGFATPALLSTGENRPIPLFAYILLLNVGLAWVAYRQTWPILTALTLALTTIYQWGWVFKFLSQSELPLALGIFLVFPIVSFAGLAIVRRSSSDDHASGANAIFERTSMLAAALPVLFAAYLAAVPAYGPQAGLLFGFVLIIDAGLLAITIARGQSSGAMTLHATGAVATLLVTAVWLAMSYVSGFRHMLLAFTSAYVVLYLAAPIVARWFSRTLSGPADDAEYAAPLLLFVVPALAWMEPTFVDPLRLFGVLLVLLAMCAWRAIATADAYQYFIAAFFAVAAQGAWSVQHLTVERLRTAVALYAVFGLLTAAVPLIARRIGRALQPAGAAGAMLLGSMLLLLFLAAGDVAPVALWALALLLAILNAGMFIESASARLPLVAQAGTVLSWVILATWWTRAAAAVGVLPSLAVLTGLTLVTLGGYAWAFGQVQRDFRLKAEATKAAGTKAGAMQPEAIAFAGGLYLAFIGHLFLFFFAANREWSVPPWPLFGTLTVITLATSATSLVTRRGSLHAVGAIAAALIVMAWTSVAGAAPWPVVGLAASGVVTIFGLAWMSVARPFESGSTAGIAAVVILFLSELTAIIATTERPRPAFAAILAAHVANASVLLALAWSHRWARVAVGSALMAALGVFSWQVVRPLSTEWKELLLLAGSLYTVFTAYPLIVGPRAKGDREPWMVALVSAATTFFAARAALDAAGLDWMIGAVPVIQGLVTAILLRALLRLEPAGQRDLGRLAIVAAAALSFVTVAIPLQLDHQWITIGWALEGAALAWLYRRIPHRGLLLGSTALLATAFARLALNPAVFAYEPRGAMRIFNWYLYTYLIVAVAMFAATWWLTDADDHLADGLPRVSHLLPAGAVILLFFLLNIEIADYYSTGPEITFRFGATVSQDLTYTIGWLAFGMLLLAGGIYAGARPARVTAVSLIAITTFKCFLYDLASLGGLYRVASFVGLALSLALVSIVLQKYVLDRSRGTA